MDFKFTIYFPHGYLPHYHLLLPSLSCQPPSFSLAVPNLGATVSGTAQ